MPRINGVYFLPSPPSPFVPGSLCAAEDVNTVQEDIAQALTGSLPLDGSAAMTSALNMNGQNINGVNALSMNGPLNAPSATISVLSATNFQAPVYNSSVNFVGNNISNVGTMNVIGAFSAATLQTSSDCNVGGNVNCSNNVNCNYLTATNTVTCNWINVTQTVNAYFIQGNAGGSFGGSVNFNGIEMTNCPGTNTSFTAQGDLVTFGNLNSANGWCYCNELVTRDGVGAHSWAFGINGGYGYAQADGGAIFLWSTSDARYKTNVQPILQAGVGLGLIRTVQPFSFDMKMTPEDSGRHADIGLIADHMPLAFRSEAAGIYGIDVYAMLAALCQAVTELATQVEALEARLAA